jgi:hypothetical protein
MWEEDEVGGEGEGRIESAPRREVIMLPSRLSERSEGRRESVVGIVLRRFWERSRETKEGRGRGGKERRESLMNAKWVRCGKLGFGGREGGGLYRPAWLLMKKDLPLSRAVPPRPLPRALASGWRDSPCSVAASLPPFLLLSWNALPQLDRLNVPRRGPG